MASPPPPRRRWLLGGAGAVFQHVLTASTVTYDHNLSTFPYPYEPGLIARLLGVVLEAVNAYGVRLLLGYIAYMKNRVTWYHVPTYQQP